MEKSDYQIQKEKEYPWMANNHRRRILKDDERGHKKGDIVTVTSYGTFGCWDEDNIWVDFYNSETVK